MSKRRIMQANVLVIAVAMVLVGFSGEWVQAQTLSNTQAPDGQVEQAEQAPSSGLYRWRDASGRVHFSDQKPDNPNIKVEEINPSATNTVVPFRFRSKSVPDDNPPQRDAQPEPAADDGASRPLSVEASQRSCEAKKKAYAEAQACYESCGRSTGGVAGGGRNNTGCGHCTDAPMPDC